MKRLFTIFICTVCVCAALFIGGCSGCAACAGCARCAHIFDFNDRTTSVYFPLQDDGNYYYYRMHFYDFLRIDKVTGNADFYEDSTQAGGLLPGVEYEYSEEQVWTRQEGERENYYVVPEAPVVVRGQDNGHWRRFWEVSEQNYPMLENIFATYETKGVAYIQTIFLQMQDGGTYGFVNAYAYSTGALSSGGTSGVTGIIYGVFVKYDFERESFQELLRVDDGCILAFDEDTVMFYKDRAYYTQNLGENAQFICKDYAFDDGLTSYSHAAFFFNDKHFVIYLHVDRGSIRREYAYILDTDGKLISSCTKDNDF